MEALQGLKRRGACGHCSSDSPTLGTDSHCFIKHLTEDVSIIAHFSEGCGHCLATCVTQLDNCNVKHWLTPCKPGLLHACGRKLATDWKQNVWIVSVGHSVDLQHWALWK